MPRCSPAIDQRLKRPRTLPRGDTSWEPTIVLGEGYAETDAIYWLHHLTCGLARPSDRNMKVGQAKHNCVQTRCFESSRADSIYARFRAPQTRAKNNTNARFHNHAADSAYHFFETGSGLNCDSTFGVTCSRVFDKHNLPWRSPVLRHMIEPTCPSPTRHACRTVGRDTAFGGPEGAFDNNPMSNT